jgi:putative copper export protein
MQEQQQIQRHQKGKKVIWFESGCFVFNLKKVFFLSFVGKNHVYLVDLFTPHFTTDYGNFLVVCFFFNLLDLSNLWQKSCIIKNGFLLVFV